MPLLYPILNYGYLFIGKPIKLVNQLVYLGFEVGCSYSQPEKS